MCFFKVQKVEEIRAADMDDKLRQAYLYDFYGELLNDHQRRIYEEFHFQDFSLGEIADEVGISRQGVADVVKRCDRKLESYEAKLHLVEKFLRIRSDAQQIEQLTEELKKYQQAEEQNDLSVFTKPKSRQKVQGADADRMPDRTSILQQIVTFAHGIIEEL